MRITPAIFPENFEQIIEKLFVLEGLCDRVQIDICDGAMGLEKTWLPYKEEYLPEGFVYEFDCMVYDFRKYLPRVIALGATRVVMHIDSLSEEDIDEIIPICNRHRVALGLSVSNTYNVYDFAKRVNAIARRYPKVFIQVMGIHHIGAQGQPFDTSVLERISILEQACSPILIQVDGSMNPETILKVKNAGADCAVIGSYLFNEGNTKKRLTQLQQNFAR